MADDIPPGDIDFSQGVRGKYAKPLPAGMHRYVISEILKSDHIGEYPGRTWVVEATSRLEALEVIHRERPDHLQLRIVDSTEEGK